MSAQGRPTTSALRLPWLLAAASVGMVAAVAQSAAGGPAGVDRLIWDSWLVGPAPASAAQPFALVEVDDRSLAGLGAGWPLPRKTWAELLDGIEAADPRLVALAVVFAEPEPAVAFDVAREIATHLEGEARAQALARIEREFDRSRGDAALTRAIGAGAPVILGAILLRGSSRQARDPIVVGPMPTLRVAAAGVGALNLDVDDDGVARRYPLGRRSEGHPESLAVAVARAANAGRPAPADLAQVIGFDHGAPLLRWDRFSEITRVSAIDVLSADAKAQAALRGRIVFIGVTAAASERTVALAEADLPGAEFHALATAALLSGGFVRAQGTVAVLGLIETLLILALAAWGASGRPLIAALTPVAALGAHGAAVAIALSQGLSLAVFPGVLGVTAMVVATGGVRAANVLRHRAELRREMARLEAAAQRNASLAAMGNLVASVAHEVRNPLFGITSTLDALEATSSDPQLKPFVDVLRSEASRLRVLMDDLLQFGKPGASVPTLEPVDASIELGLQAVRLLAGTHGVEVVRRGTTTQPLHLLRERLSLVFKNAIENAVQHSPRGAKVTISVADVRGPAGDTVECRVRDEGPGFPEADRARLFEPFFSRRAGGTGLGLAIAQRILEEHGGTIDARNHPDGGAEIVISLPVHG